MNSNLKNLKSMISIKTVIIVFSLVLLVFFIQSCVYDESSNSTIGNNLKEEQVLNIETCEDKVILKFASLEELQQEHFALYQQYITGNEEEDILVDYENNLNFYSLRKKENDMDEGLIPDDPNFDETAYTLDPVFESMLNQDGMIIIDDRLYLWDTGCIIHSIPFSCDNYKNLLSFREAAINNDEATMHQIYSDYGMRNINTCDELQYDLEYTSENGGRVDEKDLPLVKNKNGCGYSVLLNKELISCENGRNIFKVSFESIEPLGSTVPLNLFYVTAVFGNLDDLQFAYQNLPGQFQVLNLTNEDENYGYLLPFTGTFYMSTPQTNGMQIGIALTSTVNIASGNSCMASGAINIDVTCPLGIVATKISVTESSSKWLFEFPVGDPSCGNNVENITWDFGDGSPQVSGQLSVIHEFAQPCMPDISVVTAIVTGEVCGQIFNGDGNGYTITIPLGNPCLRETYKFPKHTDNVDGKKVKLCAKIKKRSSKTKFKNVFKWRVTGDKTITSTGYVNSPTANNSGCQLVDISTIVPPKTTSGKKRNKQKEIVNSINLINANNPYQVQFTHSSGYSYTLNATDLYCSQ